MRMISDHRIGVVAALLSLATLAMCVWIAMAVNLGTAVIGLLGVAAAVWLFASSNGGPPQPIPVVARRHRR
jgi:hypothetical protein